MLEKAKRTARKKAQFQFYKALEKYRGVTQLCRVRLTFWWRDCEEARNNLFLEKCKMMLTDEKRWCVYTTVTEAGRTCRQIIGEKL
jgi:hypothetical protein